MLELRTVATGVDGPRVGIIVPRHSHTAVARNLVKRRIREIVRTTQLGGGASSTSGVVVFALPPAYGAKYSELLAEVATLRERANV